MKRSFVEIWHGDILSAETDGQDYYQFLNAADKEKAARFARPELENKYVKTRGILRSILASYLNEKPEQLLIKTSKYGKPFLPETGLFFNLSHTGNKFVIAVTNVSEIGIDLEQPRQRINLSGLVDKCFSIEEKAYWQSLPVDRQVTMFYHFWVRKEAFVKALGRGIALGLNQCVVNPERQNRFLSIPENCGLASDWKIVDVSITDEECCALVMKDMDFDYKQTKI